MVKKGQKKEVFDSAVPVPGTVFADKYEVEKVLGKGGLGVVFAATNLYTNRRVAIKLLNSELMALAGATDRLLREAQITGSVKHPNIVDIYDVGISEGKVFLVMECLQGQSLGAWMKSGTRSVSEMVRMLIDAMRGIVAAHAAGVVHRDLKPDNIFVCCDENGNHVITKVLDFGVSKFIYTAPDMEEANITQAGLMVGTPNYMPPEQIRDPRYVDQRADIYALGVILFEIVAGRIPFSSTSFGDLLVEIMQEGVPSLAKYRPALSEGIIAVVDKAVARDREQRYASVKDFIGALEPYLRVFDEEVSQVRPVSDLQKAGVIPSSQGDLEAKQKPADNWGLSLKPTSSTRPIVLAAAVIAVALVAYLSFTGKRSSRAAEEDSITKSPAAEAKKVLSETNNVERNPADPSQAVMSFSEGTMSPVERRVPQAAQPGTAVSIDAVLGTNPKRASPNRRDKEGVAVDANVAANQLEKDREKRSNDRGERGPIATRARAPERQVVATPVSSSKRAQEIAENYLRNGSESEETLKRRARIPVTSKDF